MTRRLSFAAITLFLLVGWVTAGYGQQSSKETAGGGLTRDSLYQPEQPAATPRPKAAVGTPRQSSTAHHYKYTVQVEPSSSRRSAARHRPSTVRTAGHLRVRRHNPVVRFVSWWNGWVLRTFHTKFGTVLLRTVGAQQTIVDS